jgi:SAM-dependent methyltransferase
MIKSKAWKWEILEKDDKYWNTPDPIVYYLNRRWQEKVFKNFLDIGCGLGRHTVYMAKNNFKVNAFDLSETSVIVTKEKCSENNVKAEVVVNDMLNFPYDNDSIDCMLALNVISHTDTKGMVQILKEIKRVLKPGGEIYFTLGSKESFHYNQPHYPVVDANTKIRIEDGPENGIPHFYVEFEDFEWLFKDFTVVEVRYIKKLTKHGSFSPHYHVILKNA